MIGPLGEAIEECGGQLLVVGEDPRPLGEGEAVVMTTARRRW